MVDKPLQQQTDYLLEIVLKNPYISTILNGNPFPKYDNWYLGAGCICQSVWNHLSDKKITDGIKDYDLVYYNAKDISKESEEKEQERIRSLFLSIQAEIEVVNEARVHLWFEQDFGKKIDQLKSCEDAINRWPTTATSVGVNKINGKLNVYAPYGLNDLFGMVVRPNKPSVIKWVYEKKVEKWTKKWPDLKVIPWKQI
ncbi:MAG: hypothetical protein US86_C0002G0078 [Candidatus Daviesbacteria bacterium GW2011_GWA2_38_24]|uniref:Nucleotidyltransferase family protein n=1 Tax=Candidatus Daviesbacteria bacterium GW2011_GWA2_38_24 TaxID=1618422 RepID=A0A0G0MPU8_9BACT|nr:MAG: hypothetical protein US86_C0002G0078 [Candidatus Daviesbacteria bacterium GW2011_GWA2_38_24]OGE23248.1 MAG: hypothetical protein A2688_02670 [Candidatus Daviesbacteria bacterium RIFCSPHIGHO2_01_FULL_38_8]